MKETISFCIALIMSTFLSIYFFEYFVDIFIFQPPLALCLLFSVLGGLYLLISYIGEYI